MCVCVCVSLAIDSWSVLNRRRPIQRAHQEILFVSDSGVRAGRRIGEGGLPRMRVRDDHAYLIEKQGGVLRVR